MYVVFVYDVTADRTHKLLKLGRRYLIHVQNSVLEGEITEGDLAQFEAEVDALLEPGESAIIYKFASEAYVDRSTFGDDPAADAKFL